jgi:hypothetical protein
LRRDVGACPSGQTHGAANGSKPARFHRRGAGAVQETVAA